MTASLPALVAIVNHLERAFSAPQTVGEEFLAEGGCSGGVSDRETTLGHV